MTPLLKLGDFKKAEPVRAQAHHRAHYEQIASDTLWLLWRRKWLIAAVLCTALLLAASVLLIIRPHYTAEALIVPDFKAEEPVARAGNRVEPAATANSQPSPSTDTASLVDSAARILRSRSVASAVVTHLELDKDPTFTRPLSLLHLLATVQSTLGLSPSRRPSPHDLAVNALMRRITVTNELRSYLVTVAASSEEPEEAAKLANAIALEYLRTQMIQRLIGAKAVVEREVADLSSVYGARHPSYVNGQTRLEEINNRLNALKTAATQDTLQTLVGKALIPAETVVIPSSPNILLVIGVSLGAALVVGVWLALLLERRRVRAGEPASGHGPSAVPNVVVGTAEGYAGTSM